MKRDEKAYKVLSRKERKKNKHVKATEVATPKAMAALTKAMANNPKHDVGLLRDEAGVLANSPEDAINILCNTHFYKSKSTDLITEKQRINEFSANIGLFEPEKSEWRTRQKVATAIDLFKNGKASEPDDF